MYSISFTFDELDDETVVRRQRVTRDIRAFVAAPDGVSILVNRRWLDPVFRIACLLSQSRWEPFTDSMSEGVWCLHANGERFLDERRICFAEGRIYSTDGYADTALASPRLYERIAAAWGRAGAIILLLVFRVFAVLKGKLFVFAISDVVLLLAAMVIAIVGPSTKGRSLEDASS
jgi:hypothetical protein